MKTNERLSMGSETVTLSKDALFLAVRAAIKEALLVDSRVYAQPQALLTDAHDRAAWCLRELTEGKRTTP